AGELAEVRLAEGDYAPQVPIGGLVGPFPNQFVQILEGFDRLARVSQDPGQFKSHGPGFWVFFDRGLIVFNRLLEVAKVFEANREEMVRATLLKVRQGRGERGAFAGGYRLAQMFSGFTRLAEGEVGQSEHELLGSGKFGLLGERGME